MEFVEELTCRTSQRHGRHQTPFLFFVGFWTLLRKNLRYPIEHISLITFTN